MPKFTFSHFTQDPNLHRTQIYMPPDLHRLNLQNSDLHKPRYTQPQLYTEPKFSQSQIYTDPNFTTPKSASNQHISTVSGTLKHKYDINMGLILMCYANLKI